MWHPHHEVNAKNPEIAGSATSRPENRRYA